MKKINILIILVIVITIFTNATTFAGGKGPKGKETGKNSKITVTVNNKTVKYNVSPNLLEKEVMIPVRQTTEALGGTVKWEKKKNTAWLSIDKMQLELIVGKSEFYIHRDADFTGIPETVKLNVPIQSVRGSVFVPGVKIFESIGAKVSWDSKKSVLAITRDNTQGKDITYTELTKEAISNNKAVSNWYNANYKKAGVSFKKEKNLIYVLIGAGKKATGGYTMGIDKISYESSKKAYVSAYVKAPSPDMMVTQVETYPHILIKLEGNNSIKSVSGEVKDTDILKEKRPALDLTTVSGMELLNLDYVKIRDLTGKEKDAIMQSFNEATIDPSFYIEMITGNILRVTTTDGYTITFTSYGSESNVIANIASSTDVRTFHLVAPAIAKLLLQK